MTALARVATPRGRSPQPIPWDEPWSVDASRPLCTLVFPVSWESGICIELFAVDRAQPDDAVLEEIALALVPAGGFLARKPVEKSLHRPSDDYVALFDHAPDALLVVDPETRTVRDANGHAATLLGRRRGEVVGGNLDDLFGRTPELEGVLLSSRRVCQVCADGRTLELVGMPTTVSGARVVLLAARDVTERALAEQRLETAAYTDGLTGLHNRASFDRQLHAAVARAQAGALHALLFLDLDRFKAVNDRFGHSAGDALLCEVARRLHMQLRAGDVAARLGGDEFTVLLPIRDEAEAVGIAARIQRSLQEPFAYGGRELCPDASIGVAFAGPGTGSPEAVLRAADRAMYRAKARGPGNVAVHDASLLERPVAAEKPRTRALVTPRAKRSPDPLRPRARRTSAPTHN
jgi:diguanylate cyclase (GGDEF)-like protein/PAS domain S-box-containing protein